MLNIEYKDRYDEIGPAYIITGEWNDFFENDKKLIDFLKKDRFSIDILNEIKCKVPIVADNAFFDKSECVWNSKHVHITAEWKNWDGVFPVCIIEVAIRAYCYC